MFSQIFLQAGLTVRCSFRDRLLHAVLAVAMLMLLLVPVFSLFSMRQVQELGITLTLSCVTLVLLVLVLLLGSSSVWRDIERRYVASILTLPASRSSYILGKFFGITFFIVICTLFLGLAGAVVIHLASTQYPSELPIAWGNIGAALVLDCLKFILLTAFALLFSSLSTSFFLPFFATLAVYIVGNASQGVFEYVAGPYGEELPFFMHYLVKGLYYVIPNLSAFNLKIQAIYSLEIAVLDLAYAVAYFAIYTTILLFLAVWGFNRRQLP